MKSSGSEFKARISFKTEDDTICVVIHVLAVLFETVCVDPFFNQQRALHSILSLFFDAAGLQSVLSTMKLWNSILYTNPLRPAPQQNAF